MTLKTYLINKLNSKKFRLNGLVPSNDLPRAANLRLKFSNHVVFRADELPPKVDLRSDMTPVENQSNIGSCAANTLAGAYEYLVKKSTGEHVDFSRLFIYYNARVRDQQSSYVTDKGCTMTNAIEALGEYGVCLESVWPYNTSRVNQRPDDQSYEQAKRYKIKEALRVNVNLQEMKSCLAQGFPFAFGLLLFSSFDQASKGGAVPSPSPWDSSRGSHASHALLAVGYSDQSRAFIVRNSWGENWGDQGYCYIPYDYVANPKYCFDVWTVRQISEDVISREHWDFGDMINFVQKQFLPMLGDSGEIVETSSVDETDEDSSSDESSYSNTDVYCDPYPTWSNTFYGSSYGYFYDYPQYGQNFFY